jgi:hypothetical protein
MAVMGAWLCFPQRVSAEAVALDMTGCTDPAPSEVRGLLAVELHDQLVREDDFPPPDAQTVEVRCTQAEAELSLRGTPTQRTIALANVPPELRARVLALSIAELARPQPLAAGPTPPPPAAAVVEPEVTQPDEPSEPATDTDSLRPPPGYLLWIGAEGQAAPIFSVGGSLLLRVRVRHLLAWSSAISAAQTHVDIDRGKLRVLAVSVRTGLALLLENTRVSFHVGAGVRAGWNRLTGEPYDAEDLSAAHFDAWSVGPAVFAGAHVRVSRPVFLAVELELDHLRELQANVAGGNPRKLSPWRNSVALGAGVAW